MSEGHAHDWTAAYDDVGDSWWECNCGAEADTEPALQGGSC